MRGSSAISFSRQLSEVAAAILDERGSAADAVIACFFYTAATRPDGLLAPWVAMVGGAGAGPGRVVDARALQPGKGRPRPRGFQSTQTVPMAARVSASRSVAAAQLMHANWGRISMSKVVRPALDAAKALGATARRDLLTDVAREGTGALLKHRETILRICGFHASGLLADADLEVAPDEGGVSLTQRQVGRDRALDVASVPWPNAVTPFDVETESVVACDAWGLQCALTVHLLPSSHELRVPELEISLPLWASPVMRGVTRIVPGTVIPVAHTLGMCRPSPGELLVFASQPGQYDAALDFALREPVAQVAEGSPGLISILSTAAGSQVLGTGD